MTQSPQVTQTTAQPYAFVHLTVPQEQIREVMGPGLDEVRSVLEAQGIAPAGPWFTHHLRLDPEVFDFEICVPVSSPVSPTGRVKAGQLPVAKVARTVYQGGYEGLGDAWGQFIDWIEEQGLKPAPDLWECYVIGPESSPNPSDWRTELTRPLVG